MKKIISTISFLILTTFVIAQNGMPSQADMDKMMKEAQKAMQDMDPEAKKMMESMGVKVPDLKNIPSNNEIAGMQKQAQDAQQQAIKDKKAALSGLPKTVLTDAELAAFVQNCFAAIDKMIKPEVRTNTLKIYTDCKAKGYSTEQMFGVVLGLLFKNAKDQALWLAAKLASSDMKNLNSLNNFASLATQAGGAQMAIPILQHLNKKIPENDIILNNLGQAYYALDDNDKAEEYLRFVLKILPYSSTANKTMANIAEKKGNKEAAVTFLKNSIQSSYSDEKATRLKKLGYTVNKKDLANPFPINPDPIGLRNNIVFPPFSTDVNSSVDLSPLWADYTSKMKSMAKKYEEEANKLQPIAAQTMQARIAAAIKTNKAPVGPFAAKSAYFFTDKEVMVQTAKTEALKLIEDQKALKSIKDAEALRNKKISEDEAKNFPNCPGEGCNFDQYCPFITKAEDESSNITIAAENKIYEASARRQLEQIVISTGMVINNSIYLGQSDDEIRSNAANAKYTLYAALAKLDHSEGGPSTANGACPYNKPVNPIKKKMQVWVDASKLPECPVDLSVGFGAGKVALNCQRFSFDWNEGLMAGFTISNVNLNQWSSDLELRLGVGAEIARKFIR